ncbi:MAG: transposase [Prevotella sp.]|nr:transposase [Prevotella sp.]
MLHAEDDAPDVDDWLKDAVKCKVREIRGFTLRVRKGREAVMIACSTNFSNAILEGTVNKTKVIKMAMFSQMSSGQKYSIVG